MARPLNTEHRISIRCAFQGSLPKVTTVAITQSINPFASTTLNAFVSRDKNRAGSRNWASPAITRSTCRGYGGRNRDDNGGNDDGELLRVIEKPRNENRRHRRHCLSRTAKIVDRLSSDQ